MSHTPPLHPLSRDFHWDDLVGPTRVVTADQLDQFNRDGYVVVGGVLPADVLAELTEVIDGYEAGAEAFLRGQPDGTAFIATAGQITFTVHIARRDPVAAAFVEHPVMTALAADLLGGDPVLYWDQAVYKKPEPERVFPWHQDNGYTFVEPQQYLTLWVPLSPATLQHGCPQVAAGMHRHGTFVHEPQPWGLACMDHVEHPHVAEALPGDVVAFSSLTPHLTGPNTTDEVRKAYIVQYARPGAVVVDHDGRRTPIDQRSFTVWE